LRIAAKPAPSPQRARAPEDEATRFDSGHFRYGPTPERLDQSVDHGGEQVTVVEESPVVGVTVDKAKSLNDSRLQVRGVVAHATRPAFAAPISAGKAMAAG
jgi:hypothetical protein